MEIAKGESAALTYAMEERRRILAEEKLKRDLEAKDAEACKKLILDEIDEDSKLKSLCAKDEYYAKSVQIALEDEVYAERLHEQEVAAAKRKQAELDELMKADEKIAMEHYELLSKEWESNSAKQMDDDFEIAKAQQATLDAQAKLQRLKQEAEDYLLSRKAAVAAAREEHRRMKRIAWVTSEKYLPFADAESISKQWLEADAEAEDVEDGICLTIILPQLRSLKIKACRRNRIEIDAERLVAPNDKSANVDNAQYLAEFEIDGGSSVQITDKDLSHEYSSETGLLHIYVDKVRLFDSSKDNVEDSKSERRTLIDSVKNSFKRFFGKL